jgi:23S rRNA (cytidine2498-2'-O)-methyltransferase
LTVLHQIAPQYAYIHHHGTFDHFTRPWRHKLPIYLHHLFPVHRVIPLRGDLQDFNCLETHAHELTRKRYIVQARLTDNCDVPYDSMLVQEYLQNNGTLPEEMQAGRILSILIAPFENRLTAFIGVSWATQNLSPWAGGVAPLNESVPNRAGLKLIEALDAFGVQLWKGDHALDIGAAPGAWTMILRRRGLHVTAVAPDRMYHWLADDPDIQICRMTAEDYLTVCNTTFDLITNDMILDAQESARLMVAYARHLRSGGVAIMTLKLRQYSRKRVMDHSFRILRKAYKIIRVRQLVSNRSEVTLFLRRKD